MICARGKSKYRCLKLAAREAAGRFTLCRNRHNKEGVWLPVVLRWRRRRHASQHAKPHLVISPISVFYLPQIHLHLASHFRHAESRRPSQRVSPPATIYKERVTFDRSWTRLHTSYLAAQPQRPYRFSPVYNLSRPGQPQVTTNVVASVSPQPNQTVAEQVRPRGRRSLVTGIERIFKTQCEELTRIFKTHWHTQERYAVVPSLRSSTPETLTFAGQTQKKLAQLQFDRPEELVWRRTPPPALNNEIVNDPNIRVATQRSPVQTAVEDTPAQRVSPAITRATPQQITKLDPALVDRLTDDVIRRVEKRARIERQRRGL